MERTIGIGLLGCGVVGTGTLTILKENAQSLERRLGAPIALRRVVARDRDKARDAIVPRELLSFDPASLLDDPAVDVVVELAGGLEPAGDFVRTALERKKSVVTANKFLLAERGAELFGLAEANGVDLYFEAAVCGGIPVIRVLREALASDTMIGLRGIVNGTSNFILTKMQEDGLDYAVALRLAQEAGYAEADPSLDVNGGDATHKLTILATLAFGMQILGNLYPRSVTAKHWFCRIDKLASARNQTNAPHALCEILSLTTRRSDDLKRELRDRVAVSLQRQILEHDIGQAAISRRLVGAIDRLDQRIRRLIFAAPMQPPRNS